MPAAILVGSPRPSVVTFRSDCGEAVTVCFGHDEILPEALLSPADLLGNAILSKVGDDSLREATHTFLVKVLRQGLRACHGTLICVIDKRWAKAKKLPKVLSDAVHLTPPIDFPAAILALRKLKRELRSSVLAAFPIMS